MPELERNGPLRTLTARGNRTPLTNSHHGGAAVTAAGERARAPREYGALFITFNVGGNPKKASGYFKNIAGEVVDTFTITKQ